VAEPTPFRISLTPAATLRLAVVLRRAAIFGHADRLTDCLRRVNEELASRPLEWGEPSSTLPAAKLILCTGFHDHVGVSYGVHEASRCVFVTLIEPQPRHPLYVPPDA